MQKIASHSITVIALIGFIIDRALKWYTYSRPSEIFLLVPGIEFGSFLNPSLFFFPAWRWLPWAALAVLVILFSSFLIFHSSLRVSFLPILLGGASNVFDRFAYGGVIDFIHIRGLVTINLSDILILGGLLHLIFKQQRR